MSQNSTRSEKKRKKKKREALLKAKKILSNEINDRLGESLIVMNSRSDGRGFFSYRHGIYDPENSSAPFNADKLKKVKGFIAGGYVDVRYGRKNIRYTVIIEPTCFHHIKRDRGISKVKKIKIIAFGDNDSNTISKPISTRGLLTEKSFQSIVEKELPERGRKRKNIVSYGAPRPKDIKLSKDEKKEKW